MRKTLYLLMVLFTYLVITDARGEETAQVTIPLVYPQKSIAEHRSSGICNKTVTASGIILIELKNAPSQPDADPARYLAEYYCDNILFYQTNGTKINNPGILDFSVQLDTNSVENGEHKLVINFWDKKGESAIGIKRIKTNNKNESE